MNKPQVGDQLHIHNDPTVVSSGLTHANRLRDALAAMYAVGADGSDLHDRAVESLKREPAEMTVAIIAAYGGCPPGDYPQRHALVRAACVLDHASALPFLASVALSDIPAEASRAPHSFSTVAEETIIRMSAVDGISHHAQHGDKHAIELLLRCVTSRSFSIRRAAVTGLMAAPEGKHLRPQLEALVPKDQHFIFDLKKVHVREAIQIKDPTRHLGKDAKDFGERKPEISDSSRGSGANPKTE